MLRRCVSAAVSLGAFLLPAALLQAAPKKAVPVVGRPAATAISQPVRALSAAPRAFDSKQPLPEEHEVENNEIPRSQGPFPPGARGDAALQPKLDAPSPSMPGPALTFEGLSADDDQALRGNRVEPPDTVADVGPNHVVEMVNTLFRVYDKSGNGLTPIALLSDLFAPLGGTCGTFSTGNLGDPIVLYDPLADRWLMSEFAIPNFPGPPYHQCIAISTTGDPTGTFYLYDYIMPPVINDYPHFGVWPDAYYMTDHQFNQSGTAYLGEGMFAFDRLKMLAGDPAASYIYFDYGQVDPSAGGMLASDMDGLVPPPPGTPNLFMEFRADEFPPDIDAIRIYEFHADFANPASSSITVRPDLPVAAFDARQPGGRTDVEQPPPAIASQNVDSIGDRLMHRLAYRTLAGGVQSWVLNWTVNVSGVNPTSGATYQAGVRFTELRRDPGTGAITIQNQVTYSTDPGNGATGRNLWTGSAAQDNQGNSAVGFSASSTSLFPSIVWAGRLAGDPANSLAQGEATMYSGAGSQQDGAARWGDYASMSIDPADDCTFWMAQEYYANNGNFDWKTRIGSFSYAGCTAAPKGTLSGTVTDCVSGLPVAGVSVQTAEGFFATTDATGHYSITMPPGGYTANFSKMGYTQAAGGTTVTDGGDANLDVCLSAISIVDGAGATIGAESCSPGNDALDPGENVTVSFCVQNLGALTTSDLVGTLLAGNGVTNPGPPQDFGAVVGGGAPVCRDFTFTVGALCGESVVARIQFQDGANDLGTLEYDFVTGVLSQTFSENFDGVTPPALPPTGWVAINAAGGAPLWVTDAVNPNTAPNDAFVPDPSAVSDKRLESPPIPIASAAAQISFFNNYDLEASSTPGVAYDGGVLEISIDGGAFQDILAAGGSFASNGYNRTVSSCCTSPIAGRQAWSGNSGGYLQTVANLPASANGHSVVFRWRMASDSSVAGNLWRIDTVTVLGAYSCCSLPVPVALSVDDVASSGASNVNGVFEPGEQVTVAPTWMNGGSTGVLALSGIASGYTGPGGATYTLNDSSAAYGSIAQLASSDCITGGGGDCYQMSVDNPASRPAGHWDATFGESANLAIPSGSAPTKTWTLHVGASFADVPTSNIFYKYVETIFHNGVTGGCGATGYCPTNPALRKQMAVFLLKARHGAGYTPPAAVGIFADVPPADPFAPWIEDLYNQGITGGCTVSPLNYCPDNTVLRQQMAVFLLKTLEGSSYVPPACAGVFADVACPSTFADWIEDLAGRGITGGCGSGNFCPTAPNTRGQMAVFLTKTFSLLLYGP